jgi:hypothetical protein
MKHESKRSGGKPALLGRRFSDQSTGDRMQDTDRSRAVHAIEHEREAEIANSAQNSADDNRFECASAGSKADGRQSHDRSYVVKATGETPSGA